MQAVVSRGLKVVVLVNESELKIGRIYRHRFLPYAASHHFADFVAHDNDGMLLYAAANTVPPCFPGELYQ
jgi:hypothetical protein